MSYDIYLVDAETEEPLELDDTHDFKGGNYVMGGTRECWLNVTYNYNYGKHYVRVFGEGGIRSIYGLTGAESIPRLESASNELGDDVSDDYWEPTEGNAKAALRNLLALAVLKPEGVWRGD